ncbi:MAG: NrfD/PsrC family molybdoenzyme membrane anchor subunit, partial [Acidimicrobiales bacterium]
WLVAGILGASEVLVWLAVPVLALGLATAGYTAYLFGQCEGRDLWQTPLLLPVLLTQATAAGAASLLIAGVAYHVPDARLLRWVLLAALLAAPLLAFAEISSKATSNVELATNAMTKGAYAARFWWGGVVLGIAVPVVLLVSAGFGAPAHVLAVIASVSAIVGLAGYEDAFVRAGQSVPLS